MLHTLNDMYRSPFVHILILAAFLANAFGPIPMAQADDFRLPAPGGMVHLSPEFNPPILKGIKVHPDNPFRFDFILDKGDSELSNDTVKEESSKLIKYFLASLTIPEKDLWVNLSPYEKDRIIPQSFGLTEMGRDLLAEDYMLKQITASLIYPEDKIGKRFWKRIYEEAMKRYGTTNVPVNTFNKVWIVPEKAVVYENAKAGTAYVVEAKLKVMLEQDYLSLAKHEGIQSEQVQTKDANQLGSQIVREIVIPELTKEINENKNFAQLRQVYNSLILATWYKKKIKDSILGQVYADKNKTAGVEYTSTVIPAKAGIQFKNDVEGLYQEYLKAFKKGVFNYIKEDIDPVTQELIPRKYFSGGEDLTKLTVDLAMTSVVPEGDNTKSFEEISADLQPNNIDRRNFLRMAAGFTAALALLRGPLKAQAQDQNHPVTTFLKYTGEQEAAIFNYIKDLRAKGASVFQQYLSGEKMAEAQKLDPTVREAFANFYDELRFKAHWVLFNTGREANREDLIFIAQEIYNKKENVSVYQEYGLEGFFQGIWTDYMLALANNAPHLEIITKDLIYQAGKYSKELADMVGEMASFITKKSGLDLERNFLLAWEDFNVKYLVPKGFYTAIEFQKSGDRVTYFTVAYKVDRTDQYLVNGKNILIIRGHKIDLTNMIGAFGDSMIERSFVFLDLSSTDGKVNNIFDTVHKNKPYILDQNRRSIQWIADWAKVIFRNKSKDEIRDVLVHSTLVHELFHQIEFMFRERYSGNENHFDLPIWSQIDGQRFAEETGSMLAQLIKSQDPRLELLDILMYRLVHSSQGDPYYLGAQWIMNHLDSSPTNITSQGASLQDQDLMQIRKQFDRLCQMEPDKIRSNAKELMDKYWSGEMLDALIKIDPAMFSTPFAMSHETPQSLTNTGGIDLTPANMNLQTRNLGGEIKFHVDTAMLAQLQNAPGFVPVIINIQPLKSLSDFLGINNQLQSLSAASSGT